VLVDDRGGEPQPRLLATPIDRVLEAHRLGEVEHPLFEIFERRRQPVARARLGEAGVLGGDVARELLRREARREAVGLVDVQFGGSACASRSTSSSLIRAPLLNRSTASRSTASDEPA
jgi:hypothetical protein